MRTSECGFWFHLLASRLRAFRYNINETLWNQRRMRLRHGRRGVQGRIFRPALPQHGEVWFLWSRLSPQHWIRQSSTLWVSKGYVGSKLSMDVISRACSRALGEPCTVFVTDSAAVQMSRTQGRLRPSREGLLSLEPKPYLP